MSEVVSNPMLESTATRSWPHTPLFCVPTTNRISMPTVRPAAIETSMPVTECHESTTITAAMAYRIFQLHLTVERVRRGPAAVRKDAMPA